MILEYPRPRRTVYRREWGRLKKPSLVHNLFIDSEGLHCIGFSDAERPRIVYREHIGFSKLAGSPGAEGRPGIDPLQLVHGSALMADWLKSSELHQAAGELLKKQAVKSPAVSLCFSETFSVYRFFTMPRIDKGYRRKAIPIEARKHIPFALEECLYDWKTIDLTAEDRPMLGVLFVAMRRDLYDA